MKKIENYPKKHAINLTKIWQELGPNTYPLDVSALIDGAIQSSSFGASLKTELHSLDSLEGCLLRVGGTDKWKILLNQNIKNKRRLRFTHAHELGHFMCHRGLQDSFEDGEDTLNDYHHEIEAEANTFASWLLMPANVVRDEFSSLSWCVETLCEMGNRFECSLQASGLRFANVTSKPIAFVVSRDGMILWAKKTMSVPFLTAFKFGNELPDGSEAKKQSEGLLRHNEPVDSGFSWNQYRRSTESQYFDTSGLGYQYTCIEFET